MKFVNRPLGKYGNEIRGYNSMGMRLEGTTVWE